MKLELDGRLCTVREAEKQKRNVSELLTRFGLTFIAILGGVTFYFSPIF